MPEVVADCPRCGAQRMTLDAKYANFIGMDHGWLRRYELYCVCRNCDKSSIFRIAVTKRNADVDVFLATRSPIEFKGSLNQVFTVERYIGLRDNAGQQPPDYVPEAIQNVFAEGATSVATECWNAAGAMFRKCIDLATAPLLPGEEPPVEGLNSKTRRDLGLRLKWLFDNGVLPGDLRRLAACIHQDGQRRGAR